jgi:succinate dehydrogenase / fumarate reductase membrane anchor subunit
MMTTSIRTIQKPEANFETRAWQFMRYSGVLLIPLVWFHVLLQDVIVGVHAIDVSYVALRWDTASVVLYDILLLAFTFAHGVNGLRQVLMDYVKGDGARKWLSTGLLVFWVVISFIGAYAIIASFLN